VRRVVDHAVVGVLMQTRIRYHTWRQGHCRVGVCGQQYLSLTSCWLVLCKLDNRVGTRTQLLQKSVLAPWHCPLHHFTHDSTASCAAGTRVVRVCNGSWESTRSTHARTRNDPTRQTSPIKNARFRSEVNKQLLFKL
jgi:hypothetical protein